MKHLTLTILLASLAALATVAAASARADRPLAEHTPPQALASRAGQAPSVAALSVTAPPADDANHAGANHARAEHGSPPHIEISPAMAERAGIRTRIASAGQIAQSLRVYGNVSVPPGHMAQVRARFPGVVRTVNVQLGDAVRKGELLAIVESNDSLRSYSVQAPITGVVQALNVAPGDLATDAPLLTLLDDSALSLELKIFPQQRTAVHAGQALSILHTEPLIQSEITHLMPVPGAPYVIARAPLDNSTGRFAPGDLLAADIVLARTHAAVIVDNRALQQVESQSGVFIETEEGFVFQPLTLGQRDAQHTEVIHGLDTGTHYVVENSYLIKADLEKAGATHEH